MYCKKCGAEIEDDSVYCPECGVKIRHNEEIPEVPYSYEQEESGINGELEEPGRNKESEWPEDIQYSDDTSYVECSEALKHSEDMGYPEIPEESKTGNKRLRWLVGGLIGVVLVAAAGIISWKILKPSEPDTTEPTVKIGEAVAQTKSESQDEKSVQSGEETGKQENIESNDTVSVEFSLDSGTVSESETDMPENIPEQNSVSGSSFILETEEPDLTSLREAGVITANATSTFAQPDTDHSPMLLFDKKDNTFWQEGMGGHGKGEGVSFGLDDTYQIQYLGFKLGNWTDDQHYTGSSKPKTVTFTAGNSSGQVTFTGEKKAEWVKVDPPVTADTVLLKINDVYAGTAEGTCITEIMVYGK